ncbi:MAG: DUF934 domain-containing protein [Pseudomonadota bacterium]
MPSIDLGRAERITETAGSQGRLLENTEDPRASAGALRTEALIRLQFPGYKDGRAYSQARILRDDMDFGGDIRAEGEVLPDQIVHMRRCGFSSAIVAEEHVEAALEALRSTGARYQRGVCDGASILDRRRAARAVGRAA